MPGQERAVTFTIARLPPDLRYDSNTRYYYTLFRLSREWNWGKPGKRNAGAPRRESTEHVSKTPATHAARTHHGTHPTIQAAHICATSVQVRDGPSPPGGQSLPTSCLTPRTPVHEGATGERSTAEHYGQRRTFQTCCPKLPRCHGLWLFAPPRCPVWLPAAGLAGIRLLTHASILQSWRIGVTERLTD